MVCLKCGKETDSKNVFCSECLQVMDAYPVKPDTPVHLIPRPPRSSEKQSPYKKEASPKDTSHQLRVLIRWLTAIIAVLSVLLCILAGMLLQIMDSQQPPNNIGRNYTTDVTPQS